MPIVEKSMNLWKHWRPFTFGLVALVASVGSLSPTIRGTDSTDALTDFHLVWSWSTLGDGIGLAGLEIADLDGDGESEIVVGSGYPYGSGRAHWSELEFDGEIRHSWSSLPYEDGPRKIQVIPGTPGVVVVGIADSVQVFDGRTKQLLRSIPLSTTELRSLVVADLDGDGALELAICDLSDLFVHDFETGVLEATRSGFGCWDAQVGQIDDDPQLELALAGDTLGGFVLDGVSLAVDFADLAGFGRIVRLADLDGNGRDEIVSESNPFGIRARDPRSGLLLWEHPNAEVQAIAVADLTGGPADEILWGEGQWGAIHALHGTSGNELWAIDNPEHGVTSLAAGDVDGDGDVEVLWGAGYSSSGPDRLLVADAASQAIVHQTIDLRGGLVGFATGDFDGDVGLELVTASHESDTFYGGVPIRLDLRKGRVESVGPAGALAPDRKLVELTGAQLDDDSPLEFCISASDWENELACSNGDDWSELYSVELPEGERIGLLVSAELDGDPFPELLGRTPAFIYAFEGESGWLKWRTPLVPGIDEALDLMRVADIDASPGVEVVTLRSETLGQPSDLMVFSGSTGALMHGPFQVHASALDVAQLDADSHLEVVLGQSNGSAVSVDPATGGLSAPLASFSGSPRVIRVLDLTRDGVLDFLAAVDFRLEVFDGAANGTTWVSPYLGRSLASMSALHVGDFDGDGVTELAVRTWLGVALYEGPLLSLLTDGFESGDTANWSSTNP